MACGCDWYEEAEAQDGIERGLHAKTENDWDNVPAVAHELRGGVVPALRPGENAEIERGNEGGAEQEGRQGNEESFHR